MNIKPSPLFLLAFFALPTVASAAEPTTGTLIQLSGLGMLVVGASTHLLVNLLRKKP